MNRAEKLKLIRSIKPPVEGLLVEDLLKIDKGAVIEDKEGNTLYVVTEAVSYQSEDSVQVKYKVVSLEDFSSMWMFVEQKDEVLLNVSVKKIPASRVSELDGVDVIDVDGYGKFFVSDRCEKAVEEDNVIVLDYISEDEESQLRVEFWDEEKIECHFYQGVCPSVLKILNA